MASCIDPVYIANENTVENYTLKFSRLVEELVYFKRITCKVGDDATEQLIKVISEVVLKYEDKFIEFDKYQHPLNTFFSQFLLEKCYESPCNVFVLIFCLFNGQASIERGFEKNNDCSIINQSKESLIALRTVKGHLNVKNVTAVNIPITRNMKSNAKATRARYFEEIEQKKKEGNQSKVNSKGKIVPDEITDVQKKGASLQESIMIL